MAIEAKRSDILYFFHTVVRQLQAVLAHAPLGIALTRGDRIEVVSLQACRMLGHEPQELQGRDLQTLLAPQQGGEGAFGQVHAQFEAHGAFDGELALMPLPLKLRSLPAALGVVTPREALSQTSALVMAASRMH